jgi:hypothetical protein
MKNRLPVLVLALMLILHACKKESPDIVIPDQSFVEEFDTVSAALSRGWRIVAASSPPLALTWEQGGNATPWFPAYSPSGSNQGFIGASAEITAPISGTPVISSWLLSPEITFQNGDKIIFYTRTRFASSTDDFGNRLQVRLSRSGASVDVGTGKGTGVFKDSLLDINKQYFSQSSTNPNSEGYPSTWTRFESTISNLPQPVSGRFAFRYYIEDANNYGWGVGVDQVKYVGKK